jgi:hypothetical protein
MPAMLPEAPQGQRGRLHQCLATTGHARQVLPRQGHVGARSATKRVRGSLSTRKMRSTCVSRSLQTSSSASECPSVAHLHGGQRRASACRQQASPVSELLTNQHRDHAWRKRHSQSTLRLPALTHPL